MRQLRAGGRTQVAAYGKDALPARAQTAGERQGDKFQIGLGGAVRQILVNPWNVINTKATDIDDNAAATPPVASRGHYRIDPPDIRPSPKPRIWERQQFGRIFLPAIVGDLVERGKLAIGLAHIGQAVDEDDRHAQVGNPVRGESIVDHQGHIRLFGRTFGEAVMQTQQVFRQAGYACVTVERNVGMRQLVQNETEFAYPAPAIVPDCSKEREFWPVGRHVVCRGPGPPSSACRGAIKHAGRTRAIREHPRGARNNTDERCRALAVRSPLQTQQYPRP